MASAEPPVSADPVRTYIAFLALELDRADAALRHDALIDAEAHLRAAIAAGASPGKAIADYGTPQEIAAAYLEADGAARPWAEAATVARAGDGATGGAVTAASGVEAAPAQAHDGAARRRWRFRDVPVIGIWGNPRAWSALAFFGVVSFPLATAYFVWSVAVGSVAIGLMPVLVGAPILVLLLGSARAICLFEGKVVEALLGVRMPRRTQPVAGADQVEFWQRIWCWLRDIRSWMSLGYLLGNFFVSVVTFALTVTLTAASAAFLLLPLLQLLGLPMAQVDGVETVTFLGRDLAPDADGNVWFPASATVPCVVIGLVGLTAVLWMVRGFGWVYGHVVQAIQVARPQPTVPPRTR